MDLTGQVVLITGGSRGLGRAFAQALLAAGARVAIIDILATELHETAAQLSSAANKVVAIRADVTDPQAAPQVVTTVEERLGPITLLINSAGQFRAFGPIGVVDPIAWWNEVEVNLRGPFLYANAVLPGMRRRHRGRSSTWRVARAFKASRRSPPMSQVRPPSSALVKPWRWKPLKMAFRFLPSILEPSAHR
jgi:3-oxoacyl-[acyl-carrier protein] reductase